MNRFQKRSIVFFFSSLAVFIFSLLTVYQIVKYENSVSKVKHTGFEMDVPYFTFIVYLIFGIILFLRQTNFIKLVTILTGISFLGLAVITLFSITFCIFCEVTIGIGYFINLISVLFILISIFFKFRVPLVYQKKNTSSVELLDDF